MKEQIRQPENDAPETMREQEQDRLVLVRLEELATLLAQVPRPDDMKMPVIQA